MTRPRILTGDTPTGRLHLGHLVGSLENRVRLQDDHECFFLIANVHAYTTRAERPDDIRRDTIEVARDYLAAGIDPERSTLVLQSEIRAIPELTFLLAMLLPFARVMRNPTLKAELADKQLDQHSFGFPLYTVGQCADILAFRADLVPVGEDQAATIEMCREVARRFERVYGGAVFPVPEVLLGRVARLAGTDGVHKMSKSLGNAIFLSDSRAEIHRKMRGLYTGRQSATDPGDPDSALVQYARAFVADPARARELTERYTRGEIGDGALKAEVADAIDAVVAPMRERRAAYDGPRGEAAIVELLHAHARHANAIADQTLARVKEAMRLDLGGARVVEERPRSALATI
jgi:tryptophanyl-tRNA synthetase